ncbi:MAG: ABC transporter ATP-binding protein [Ilumatobacteraceae bacterium]
MSNILEVANLTKRFGGVTAVDDCSFGVLEHSITALIGPNGSGKTTAFNIITGYLPADSGHIVFGGKTMTRPRPAQLARLGLCRTFQQARVFNQLTARENLIAASQPSWRHLFGARSTTADRELADELLADFNLSAQAEKLARDLSYGQRKLLEFAAALVGDPQLVLLDEPSAGVNPVMIETMERHVRSRHAAGATFLIVEHDMNLVMRLCDPIIVLDQGSPIATGTPGEIQTNSAVLDAYLGA